MNGKGVVSQVWLLARDSVNGMDANQVHFPFKPIPLTTYLLENVGFKEVKAKSGIQKAYKKSGIRIELSNSGNFYYKNKSILYFHQLQNLYYFTELSGEELKTKLNDGTTL